MAPGGLRLQWENARTLVPHVADTAALLPVRYNYHAITLRPQRTDRSRMTFMPRTLWPPRARRGE